MKILSSPAFAMVAALVSLSGCASFGRTGEKNGTLQGMIYDYENRPVCGYQVSVGENHKAMTDINGRFIIPGIPFGTHILSGEGTEHGPCTRSVAFADKTQILYLRVPSNAFLYSQVDRQLSDGEYDAAMSTLGLFSVEERRSRKFNLYQAIALFRIAPVEARSGYYARARELTEELLDE